MNHPKIKIKDCRGTATTINQCVIQGHKRCSARHLRVLSESVYWFTHVIVRTLTFLQQQLRIMFYQTQISATCRTISSTNKQSRRQLFRGARMQIFKVNVFRNLSIVAVLSCTIGASLAHAGPREQAKRIHDRLAGVPPSAAVVDSMAAKITNGDGVGGRQ